MDINNLFKLYGKVAVVTGGGDGIGKGCAQILASAGASIVVSDINLHKAQAVADTITSAGGKAIAVACNVLDDANRVKLIDSAVNAFGTLYPDQ